jgi:2-succinyl-5-enolpyruvyl-6-hydroxy-3-cyclohexene-1-carboxylate synthase
VVVNPSTAAARALVDELVRAGIGHVVLAPGSRSAPLAFAVAAAATAGRLRLHVRVDERVAGFTALGLARAAGPTAIVTTSGTAVANLHPAVLEAHHSGIPLVVLSADRPHELRGTGASQTTDQVRLFGPAVRLFADVPAPYGRDGEDTDVAHLLGRALAAARGDRSADPGPVHLNLSYREPLVPDDDVAADVALVAEDHERPAVVVEPRSHKPDPVVLDHVPETVVVAGDGAGPAAAAFAAAGSYPLLAEPSSGARFGPHALTAYRLVLGRLAAEVRRVVVFGRPTLSRPISRLLAAEKTEVVIVAPGGAPWTDAGRQASRVVPAVALDLDGRAESAWLTRWRSADEGLSAEIVDVLETSPLTGLDVATGVWESVGGGDALIVGSSNPIRDLDLVARPPASDTDLPWVVANRGLAGIDGTLSTATGTALATGRPTTALVGDLTFLHDAGGLLLGPDEEMPDLRVVVVNDDGGAIFNTLETGDARHREVFERVFGTPHHADLGALCRAYGVVHRRVTSDAELRAALSAPGAGRAVIEAVVDRGGLRDLYRTLGLITE